MAERLGVDEETVRRGINRAREIGFLGDIQLIINPSLLGYKSGGIEIEIDDVERKSTVIGQIARLNGVTMIINFVGNPLRASFYFQNEDDFQETVQRISLICNSKPLRFEKTEYPPCNLKLHPTDWQIIRALRKDPRRQVSDLAKEVGVSTKTVKRRLDIMTQHQTFYLVPELNYDNYPGVASSIIVIIPDQAKKIIIDKQITAKLDSLVFSWTDNKTFSVFTMVCMNMSEADEIDRWIRSLDGVQNVRMDFIKEGLIPREWLDTEIERRVQSSEVMV